MSESTSTSAVQVVDGVELPAPGRWNLDAGHADVGFVGRHFMLTRVRGRFVGVEGAIEVGARPEDSTVVVDIDMASVSSGDQARDDHLRSADFFDVERHPSARFTSTGVAWSGRTGRMSGRLTIKGVTRPVDLDVEYLGHVTDPWGSDRAVFSARGKVNREDWGLTWNMLLDSGGVVVSKDIELDIHAEFVRQA